MSCHLVVEVFWHSHSTVLPNLHGWSSCLPCPCQLKVSNAYYVIGLRHVTCWTIYWFIANNKVKKFNAPHHLPLHKKKVLQSAHNENANIKLADAIICKNPLICYMIIDGHFKDCEKIKNTSITSTCSRNSEYKDIKRWSYSSYKWTIAEHKKYLNKRNISKITI